MHDFPRNPARCGQFCQACMDSWFDFNFFWRTLRHGLKSWFSTNSTLTMITCILPWIIFCKIVSDGSICSKSLSGWRKLSAMTPVKEMIQLVTVFSSTPSSEMLILEFLCSAPGIAFVPSYLVDPYRACRIRLSRRIYGLNVIFVYVQHRSWRQGKNSKRHLLDLFMV